MPPDKENSLSSCKLWDDCGVLGCVTSTVFESKDEPTQMTKQSFTIIYFITYKKTIHFKLICKNVHS